MRARSALVYTVLRLLAFLVPLGILLLFPVFQELPWLAAIFAALIGFSLSLLFLRRPLDNVTGGLAERRAQRTASGRRTGAETDADAEDAAMDSAQHSTPRHGPTEPGETPAT
jgi:ABC-type siderophore export system fused ATPase/permease subunit